MYMTPRLAWLDMTAKLEGWSKRAHRVFEASDWKWQQEDGYRVPTQQEIWDCAWNLLWSALLQVEPSEDLPSGRTHSCVSSGRLQARFAQYGDGAAPKHWVCTLCIPLEEEHCS
jgi:hypothetical protein